MAKAAVDTVIVSDTAHLGAGGVDARISGGGCSPSTSPVFSPVGLPSTPDKLKLDGGNPDLDAGSSISSRFGDVDIYGQPRPAISSRFARPASQVDMGLLEAHMDDRPSAGPILLECALGVHGRALPQTQQIDDLITTARRALRSGGRIEPIDGTVNGVYQIKDRSGAPVAIFKPQDEERSDDELSRGSDLTEAIERGCPSGQSAKREYLAYMLDAQSPPHFQAGIPPTSLIRISHPFFGGSIKVGSLQAFVPNRGSSEDWGSSSFSAQNVQRIALFDLRTLNLDRHGGNMVVDHAGDLVPIDHGYAFPETLGEPWFDWRLWPQAKLNLDAASTNFVASLDPMAAKGLVQDLGLGDGVWRTVAVMTLLLQASVQAGLTLYSCANATMRPRSPASQQECTDRRPTDSQSIVEKLGKQLYLADRAADDFVRSGPWPWPGAGLGSWLETSRGLVDVAIRDLVDVAAQASASAAA